ncbi:THAP domain-containing protein 6-like [Limulus polyphemus]|uniref:THAP domain-containing protein 6-like n=1 Tax=Limulus polyphemus TaxID=6850 RepID=A0ABM1BFS6_LIMPO|nr:THAP domain-containing protein 6-like [Limulus polyphemus]
MRPPLLCDEVPTDRQCKMAETDSRRTKSRPERTKGTQCYAINCYTYRNQESKAEGVTFHKFPDKIKNKELYELWVRNCGREREPTNGSRICSKHFDSSMINRTLQRTHLREDAVPIIFKLREHRQPRKAGKRKSNTSTKALLTTSLPNEEENYDTASTSVTVEEQITKEHSYHICQDDMKRRIMSLQQSNEELRKSIRNAKLREKRAKGTSKALLQELVGKNLITAELEMKLASYKDIPWELFSKPSCHYSKDQRNFALTLHLYSPKAYKYLRDTINLSLPAPRTLRRWLEEDGEPVLQK